MKVTESSQADVNKGVVRIHAKIMKDLKLQSTGDYVELRGKRLTVAIAGPHHVEAGLDVIRMDGITRTNADTSIGELIEVAKAEVHEAQRVAIAPVRKDITKREVSMKYFKQALDFIGPSLTDEIKQSYVKFESLSRKRKGAEMEADMKSYVG